MASEAKTTIAEGKMDSAKVSLGVSTFVKLWLFGTPPTETLTYVCISCCGHLVDEDDPNKAFSSMLSERERTIKEQVKLQTQKVRKLTWTEGWLHHMHDISA